MELKYEIYIQYKQRCRNHYRGYVNDVILEEIINDSFVVAVDKYDETRASFITFLFLIVKHKIYQHFKNNKMVFVDMVDYNGDDLATRIIDALIYEEYDDEEDENFILMLNSIMEMEKHKLEMKMFYIDGMKIREIADLLKININTIKSRLKSGKKQLMINIKEKIKDNYER